MADDYALSNNEVAAVRSLLTFQAQLANGAAPANPDAFCSKISTFLASYPSVQNVECSQWFHRLFTTLHKTTTIGGQTFPVLQMLWDYARFCNREIVPGFKAPSEGGGDYSSDWTSFWYAFINGQEVLIDQVGGGLVTTPPPTCHPPSPRIGLAPPPVLAWANDTQQAIGTWKQTPPPTLVANDNHRFEVTINLPLFGDTRPHYFDTSGADGLPLAARQSQIVGSWDIGSQLAGQVAGDLVGAQGSSLDAVIEQQVLTGDDYYFVLYLLIGLVTGTSASSARARSLISSLCAPPEYPNDVFANQLVYSVLLTLGDPSGSWGMDNGQLRSVLEDLRGPLLGKDPGSVALRDSLAKHHRILVSDAAYPLQDPYTETPFPERQTDTLFALDASRRLL